MGKDVLTGLNVISGRVASFYTEYFLVIFHLQPRKRYFGWLYSFESFAQQTVEQRILEGHYDFDGEEWKDISGAAKNLIRGLVYVSYISVL